MARGLLPQTSSASLAIPLVHLLEFRIDDARFALRTATARARLRGRLLGRFGQAHCCLRQGGWGPERVPYQPRVRRLL